MKVKRGVTKHKRHKKILKLAKGYRMTYSKTYRKAKEAVLHAGQYSYNHRKHRHSQFRKEWIRVISAYLMNNDLGSYSKFMNQLKNKMILIDRKVLANMILKEPKFMENLVSYVYGFKIEKA